MENSESTTKKRGPGRPRKEKKENVSNKPKLTLKEKQEIKLKKQKEKQINKPKNKNTENYYCTNKELQAELIKWRDSNEIVEERIISEDLGKMFLMIANKLLNHSNFRNYTKELKEDMRSYAMYKLIKGLKNYNFNFNNPFAYCTQGIYNAYITIIAKHYKQQNIKRDLLRKLTIDLESYTGISPNSSLNRCIKSYLSENED